MEQYLEFLKQKLENKPFTIVGDGNQTRDFIFSTDVAEAFRLCAESQYINQIYNLGNGEPKSINYIAELIGGKKLYSRKTWGTKMHLGKY